MTPETQALTDQVNKLKREVEALTSAFYQNNFASSQDFNKSSRFNTRLKVPHYDTAPTTAEVGEIIEVAGELYICSSANTFVLVGTQS